MLPISRLSTSIFIALAGLFLLTACPQTPAGEVLPTQGETLPWRASKMEIFKNGELVETYKFTFDELGQMRTTTVNDEGFLTRSIEGGDSVSTQNLKSGVVRKLKINAQGHVINEKLFEKSGQLESEHEISYSYSLQDDGQTRVSQKVSKITSSDGQVEEATTNYAFLYGNGGVKVETAVTKTTIDGVLQEGQESTNFEYSPLGHLEKVMATSGYLMKIDVDSAGKTRTYLVDSGIDGEVDSVAMVTYEMGPCRLAATVYQPERPTPSECSDAF